MTTHERIDVLLSLPGRSPEVTIDDTDVSERKHPHDEENGDAKLQKEQSFEESSEETTYVSWFTPPLLPFRRRVMLIVSSTG